MTFDGWQRLESVFHTAIQLRGAERLSYISTECAENEELFSEVQKLVSAFESSTGFLNESLFTLGLKIIERNRLRINPDQQIGCYKIHRKIGSGGMGEVFLATDTRLDRKVALKFLLDLTDNEQAPGRFMKEAQASAKLDHNNICAVHSVEEIDGYSFIVMQYINGCTLTDHIGKKPLAIGNILDIALQIVSAIANAHSHGVLHRDIKPGNIMLNEKGEVKVLDFGLAVNMPVPEGNGAAANAIGYPIRQGLILGTVAYMSPEQLKGENLDFRSDIFSIGVVLYELLCRNNPFLKNNQAETISAILKDRPQAIEKKADDLPEPLLAIIQKCLEKKKERRFQSAEELLSKINKIKGEMSAAPLRSRTGAGAVSLVLTALVLFLVLGQTSSLIPMSNYRGKILAILPIANLSQEPLNFLSEGLTESLINSFSRLKSVKVRSPAGVKNAAFDAMAPQEIGQRLNADMVLTGNMVQNKDLSLNVLVRLIRVSDGIVLKEKSYPFLAEQLTASQEKIFSDILIYLGSSLDEEEKKLVLKKMTDNEEAARSYFQGIHFLKQRGKGDLKEAIRYFQDATDRDPSFARAWAGMANAYSLLSLPAYEGLMSSKEALEYAKAAANQAIKIDNSLCEPHISLGVIHSKYEWDWQEAETDLKMAILLDPDSASAHNLYSYLLVILGRFDEAETEAKKGKELDPFSTAGDSSLARVFYFKKDYERSLQIFENLHQREPENENASYLLGLQYLTLRRFKEAIDIFEKIYGTHQELASAALGYAYAKVGRKKEAEQVLNKLEQLSQGEPISPQEWAIIYIGLGEKDKAFEKLNAACSEHYPALPYLLLDPLFDELHSDNRFIQLRQCAKLQS